MRDYAELVKKLRDCRNMAVYSKFWWDITTEAADAIEELKQNIEQYKLYLQDAINDLRSAHEKEPKWISVEERLPEPFENIFAANKRGKHYDIDKAWWNGSVFDRCAKGIYRNVTHWMPLPEPPNGVE